MIPNITRGGRMVGVLRYLAGPGRENEHHDPRLVAGDAAVMAWRESSELDEPAARELAHELDHPRRAFGTRVTTAVKDADGRPAKGARGHARVRDAHVWHCSLNLAPEDGALSDEQWARVAEEFVEEMGFGGEHPCRWVAVRHGASKGGNDHVHLVVSLVREDGTKANAWNDRPRAQRACGALERRHGLRVLESRAAGRGGTRGHKPAERAIADRVQRRREVGHESGELARDRVQRTVRACAAAAQDEAEFVRRLRRAGLRVRPRYAPGRSDVVAGYSAALPLPRGERMVWYGGGRLARDLTLPRLRAQWPDTPQAAAAGVDEWGAARGRGRMVRPGREQHEPDPQLWQRYSAELEQLRAQLRSAPIEDRATWAHVAGETSGAFAAWSLRVEPTPGPLAATAAQLAHSAQLHAHQVRPRRAGLPSAKGAALLLASSGRAGRGPVGELVLFRQLVSTAQALHDAHAAAGEARTARALEDVVRGELRAVGQELAVTSGASDPASSPGRTTAPARPATPARPTPTRPPRRGRDVER